MKPFIPAFVALTTGVITTSVALAACKTEGDPASLSFEERRAIYDCIRPELVKGYQKKGKNPIAMAYTDWKPVSRGPAAPGVHSEQHLMTYVNDTGFESYVEFRTQGADMPVGTQIAKEAFSFKKNGKVKRGPLLMMEKVGVDNAPDTGGWEYSGVKPNGKKLKVDGKGFCHACHQAYAGQDFLGYPVPAVRVEPN